MVVDYGKIIKEKTFEPRSIIAFAALLCFVYLKQTEQFFCFY